VPPSFIAIAQDSAVSERESVRQHLSKFALKSRHIQATTGITKDHHNRLPQRMVWSHRANPSRSGTLLLAIFWVAGVNTREKGKANDRIRNAVIEWPCDTSQNRPRRFVEPHEMTGYRLLSYRTCSGHNRSRRMIFLQVRRCQD